MKNNIFYHGSPKANLKLNEKHFFVASKEFAEDFNEDFNLTEESDKAYLYEVKIKAGIKLFDYKEHEALIVAKFGQELFDKLSQAHNWALLEKREFTDFVKSLGYDGHIGQESGQTICIYNPVLWVEKLTRID